MNFKATFRFLFGILVILSAEATRAAVPALINYQGILTDANGMSFDTTVAATFTIYDSETGGQSLWTETQPALTVVDGRFNVLLGSVIPIDDSVFAIRRVFSECRSVTTRN